MIVRDVSGLENRVDREGSYAVYATVDGCDSADLATVIENTFDGTVQCGPVVMEPLRMRMFLPLIIGS